MNLFFFLFQAFGAVTAVGFVALVLGLMAVAVAETVNDMVKASIQSRKDAKLFKLIEEFQSDFS